MKQQTFSDIEYSNRRRKTKREGFLDSMDEMIPYGRNPQSAGNISELCKFVTLKLAKPHKNWFY